MLILLNLVILSNIPLQHERYGFGIEFVFLFEDSSGESYFVVVLHHRHGALHDDWATIKRLVYKMDRAATHLHASLERLPLRIKSGKQRQ